MLVNGWELGCDMIQFVMCVVLTKRQKQQRKEAKNRRKNTQYKQAL